MVRQEPQQYARAQTIAGYYRQALSILGEYLSYVKANNTAAQRRLEQSAQVRRLNVSIGPLIVAFNEAQRLSTQSKTADIHNQARVFTLALVALCVAGIAATLTVLLMFGFRLTRRLSKLADNAYRLASGEQTEAIGGNDEIAQLDKVYQEMTGRLGREYGRATILQRALLPQTIPTFPGVRLDVSYAAASDPAGIGGDWYDVFRISEHRIGISIGDVAGHGLDAAALMANARHAIQTVAYLDENPASVMRHVNQILCRNETPRLVTALFATFDLLDGTLRYCLAGHPPPMFVRTGGTVQEMPGKGFLLGVDARSPFETHAMNIDIGSAVILYTDGVVESGRNYFEGVTRLKDAIEEEYRNGSGNIAQAIQSRIFAETSPRDDCALLFIGVTALGNSAIQPERVFWTLDARSEQSTRRVKRAVLWHLGEIAGEDADLSLSELIVSEMLGNVARHTPGPAEVVLEWKGESATVHVFDRGRPFQPPVHQDAAALLDEGGRGIFLIRAVAAHFDVRWTGEGNCVSAVLPLVIGRDALIGLRKVAS